MLVLCPKAFSSNDGLSYEREFLKYYLSKTGKKAVIANEIWETFRYKLKKTNPEEKTANRLIAEFRGIFEPEELKIDENHQEVEPENEHNIDELNEKTKDLLERRWADIEIFITTDTQKFEATKKVKMMTLQEFLLNSMNNYRSLFEEFNGKVIREKWE